MAFETIAAALSPQTVNAIATALPDALVAISKFIKSRNIFRFPGRGNANRHLLQVVDSLDRYAEIHFALREWSDLLRDLKDLLKSLDDARGRIDKILASNTSGTVSAVEDIWRELNELRANTVAPFVTAARDYKHVPKRLERLIAGEIASDVIWLDLFNQKFGNIDQHISLINPNLPMIVPSIFAFQVEATWISILARHRIRKIADHLADLSNRLSGRLDSLRPEHHRANAEAGAG